MATEHRIISGPSKWDLMLALFDGDISHRRPVRFFILNDANSEDVVGVVINSLEREDGSDENWNFSGVVIDWPGGSNKVKGFFSTQMRRGTMTSKS